MNYSRHDCNMEFEKMNTKITWPGGEAVTVPDTLANAYLQEQLRLRGWGIAVISPNRLVLKDAEGGRHEVLVEGESA